MNSVLAKMRLSGVMTLVVCATVTLTLALQLILVNHFAVGQAREEAQLRLQQLSWQMRDSLDRVIEQAAGDTRLLVELPQVRYARNADESRAVLESLQRTFPDYAWIGIANLDGKVIASTGGMLEGANVSKRPWFTVGLRGVHATDYHPAVLLEKVLPHKPDPWRFVDASGPILDADGKPAGVLGLHLSWEWARRRARQLLIPALREYGAEILVIRDDGTVMLGPEPMIETRVDTTSLRLAQKGMTGSLREVWPDGRAYLTGYSQTGDMLDPASLRWSVLVRQTEQRALEGTVDLKQRMLGWSALLALALAGAAAMIARHLTRPMAALGEAIERVTQASKAGKDAPPLPQADGFLETRILSSTMRELVHSQTVHRQALLALNERLEAAVAERTAELQATLLRDALTGLPNRRALLQALPGVMGRARRVGRPCALLFLDMDGFKEVNDTYGYEEGDELLRQFGERLLLGVRQTDLVARLAGDEFVVALEMLGDAAHADDTARKLLERLREPFVLRGATVKVGASIGIALHRPGDPYNVDDWLARANHAMYAVKRTGKNGVALAASF